MPRAKTTTAVRLHSKTPKVGHPERLDFTAKCTRKIFFLYLLSVIFLRSNTCLVSLLGNLDSFALSKTFQVKWSAHVRRGCKNSPTY